MAWERGRAEVEGMLQQKQLERVPANEDEARYLLDKANVHIQSVGSLKDDDPETAYDAA